MAEVRILHAAHSGLGDLVHAGENVFCLLGENVLAAGDDHVVAAAGDVEQAVFVVAEVAGGHHAIDGVLVRAGPGVALEEHVVFHEDAPDLTLGELVSIVVDDLQRGGQRWLASGAGMVAQLLRGGDGSPANLRGTVEIVEHVAEFLLRVADDLRRQGLAGCGDDLRARVEPLRDGFQQLAQHRGHHRDGVRLVLLNHLDRGLGAKPALQNHGVAQGECQLDLREAPGVEHRGRQEYWPVVFEWNSAHDRRRRHVGPRFRAPGALGGARGAGGENDRPPHPGPRWDRQVVRGGADDLLEGGPVRAALGEVPAVNGVTHIRGGV